MITEETKIKNAESLARVTNAKSKDYIERINKLATDMTEDGEKGKAFIVLAKFDADENRNHSIQSAGVVGTPHDLSCMIAETMEASDQFKHIILQAATMFTLGNLVKDGGRLSDDEDDEDHVPEAKKTKVPFTY